MSVRIAGVTLLILLSMGLWVPDVRRVFGHPLGNYGFDITATGDVAGLQPGTPAERAGVRDGDSVDLARAPLGLRARIAADPGTAADAGTIVTLPLQRGTSHFTRSFATIPESAADLWTVPFRIAVSLLFPLLGAMLVLLRPSVATWAFFIFTLGEVGPVNVINVAGPDWWATATAFFVLPIFYTVTASASVIFALYLLTTPPLRGWRLIVQWAAIAVTAVAAGSGIFYVAQIVAGHQPDPWAFALEGITTLCTFATPLVLLASLHQSTKVQRARLRWVILGFGIAAIVDLIDLLGAGSGAQLLYSQPYYVHAILVVVSATASCSTVAYAILRYRVIDVNVAISRALVYALISAIVVGLFALIDLFFSRALSESKAGLIADVALALVLGFFFNGIHKSVDRFVDGMLFRTRHRAERHIETVAGAIPYAESAAQVTEFLIAEPRRAFDLAGAALVPADAQPLLHDSLIAYLQAERRALRLRMHDWHNSAIQIPGGEPAIAVPVFSRSRVRAVAFYGFHHNGTDLDNEEIALLERLSAAAGAAFDHLDAEDLEREVRSLRAALDLRDAPLSANP